MYDVLVVGAGPVGLACAIEAKREGLRAKVIDKGALVNRLSMGSPAANGDFSGVIKNSFLIEDGGLSGALSETMISGNTINMLKMPI